MIKILEFKVGTVEAEYLPYDFSTIDIFLNPTASEIQRIYSYRIKKIVRYIIDKNRGAYLFDSECMHAYVEEKLSLPPSNISTEGFIDFRNKEINVFDKGKSALKKVGISTWIKKYCKNFKIIDIFNKAVGIIE